MSVVLIKPFFKRQNLLVLAFEAGFDKTLPVDINGIEEFELIEAISSQFIDPDRSSTSHKRKASLKF